ncbi:AAA family ATPase [Endozoicomonas sp. SCSIO W0465]|uniref:AAA family ATPase n=1 Tax=Endozoicomonas sp. SCSIO W0465 TaxID=2918516 RepID=UPI0020760A71|nr:AAA family ATPase [Endozoicomonas sp. SCSIO W0465]USE35811.1 AAA family ATPase [Endozoicomonas sp. SCSIO W0465]
MKQFKQFCISLLFSILLYPIAQADVTPVTPDTLHISYVRQYMANNRFFDRLNVGGYAGQPIGTQVRAGRAEAKRQYDWVLREYTLYESLPYIAFYIPAFMVGATLHAYEVTLSDFILNRSTVNSLLAYMALSLGVAITFATFVPFTMNIYYGIFTPKLAEENLILNYGAKKALLDKRTQHYIEDELFYSFWRSPGSIALGRLQKILDKALRLPFYAKELVYDEEKIDDVLRDYPAHVADRLKLFAHSELIYQQTDASIADSHYPIYFLGAPGTGKTHAAKQLAEAMGTNLAFVSLDGASIDDIVGTPFESDDAKAGRILDAIIARTDSSLDINHHNQVLLIDEFDRLFISGNEKSKDVLSFMLKLLDPSNRSYYNPYLKTDVRLPDTIILAGNRDIHELSTHDPELEAIASRLDQVVFEGFDSRTKKKIAFDIMVPNKERRYQSAGKLFADFTLPESGREMIHAFIETDQDPGLRSLEKYIARIFEQFAHSFAPNSLPPAGNEAEQWGKQPVQASG